MMPISTVCVQEGLPAVGKSLEAHSMYQAIVSGVCVTPKYMNSFGYHIIPINGCFTFQILKGVQGFGLDIRPTLFPHGWGLDMRLSHMYVVSGHVSLLPSTFLCILFA